MDAWSTVAGVRTMDALSRLPGAIDKLTEAVKALKNETKPEKPVESKAEMPKVLEGGDREEFLGQMIDIVEDFLNDFDLVPKNEREDALLKGKNYDALRDRFKSLLENWGLMAPF